MNILAATQKPFAPAAVEAIRAILVQAGHRLVLLEKYADPAELLAAVADADALIVRSDKVTAEVIAAARQLKIIVRAGAGVDNVDLEAATARGIVVMNTPGQNANAVAELAVAMLIYASRRCFTPGTGREIMGRTLGLLAYGHVGRLVARKAGALGMKLLVFARHKDKETLAADGAEKAASVEELFRRSDYVSLHLPATPLTKGSIGRDLLVSMPEGGCLINTARKEVMDEAGLAEALAERPDLSYVTDIAPDNYPLLKERYGSRVFATPKKMGAQTAEANLNAGLAAARQIAAYFATGDTTFQVNK